MQKKITRNTKKPTKTRAKLKCLKIEGGCLKENVIKQSWLKNLKKDLTRNPAIPVVLDLSTINQIYFDGIKVIVGLYKECASLKRDLSVEISDESIHNLFKTLKLDQQVKLHKVS